MSWNASFTNRSVTLTAILSLQLVAQPLSSVSVHHHPHLVELVGGFAVHATPRDQPRDHVAVATPARRHGDVRAGVPRAPDVARRRADDVSRQMSTGFSG